MRRYLGEGEASMVHDEQSVLLEPYRDYLRFLARLAALARHPPRQVGEHHGVRDRIEY